VFYTLLLTKDPADSLLRQKYPQPLLVKTEEEEAWKVKDIINVKRVGRA
jgi:hypothetical protein